MTTIEWLDGCELCGYVSDSLDGFTTEADAAHEQRHLREALEASPEWSAAIAASPERPGRREA